MAITRVMRQFQSQPPPQPNIAKLCYLLRRDPVDFSQLQSHLKKLVRGHPKPILLTLFQRIFTHLR
jgi:hypothetical protein